jgi:hypothetical protein
VRYLTRFQAWLLPCLDQRGPRPLISPPGGHKTGFTREQLVNNPEQLSFVIDCVTHAWRTESHPKVFAVIRKDYQVTRFRPGRGRHCHFKIVRTARIKVVSPARVFTRQRFPSFAGELVKLLHRECCLPNLYSAALMLSYEN